MKNKSLPFIIGAVVVVISFGVVFVQNNNKKDSYKPVESNVNATTQTSNPTPVSETKPTTSKATKNPGDYTLLDVAKHNNQSSCWTTINGGVYDVTSWISKHPGGPEAILSICGIDGSDAFNGQHGGERRPASELATFKIGTLIK